LKVSVCIYTYNRVAWLEETLQSVLRQMRVELEILILDNGCTPETGIYLAGLPKRFLEYHPDVTLRLFRVENNGDPHPNLFELATGDYVTPLPDDDLLLGTDSLYRRAKMLEDNPETIFVFTSVRGHDVDGKDLGQMGMGLTSQTDIPARAAPFEGLFVDDFVPWPSGMIRRSCIREDLFVSPAGICGDWFVWQKLSQIGDGGAWIAQSTVSLRQHAGQESNIKGIAQGHFLRAHLNLWVYWIERGYRPTTKDWNRMEGFCIQVAAMRFPDDLEAQDIERNDALYEVKKMKALTNHPTICLAMIAKNEVNSHEGHVIERCLDSCRELVSDIVIVGTGHGNIDGPVLDLVATWGMNAGISTELRQIEWNGDFAAARNVAHHTANNTKCDWIQLLDADEILEADIEQIWCVLARTQSNAIALPELNALTNSVTPRIAFVRNIVGWNWKYALHETLQLNGTDPEAEFIGNIERPMEGPYIWTPQDGARSQDPDKMKKDIEVLRAEYFATKDPRYAFYLGRTLMAERDWEALAIFGEYIKSKPSQTGLLYCAHLFVGRLYTHFLAEKRSGVYEERAVESFLSAYRLCPTRVEALGELAAFYARTEDWAVAKVYALSCAHAPIPDFGAAELLEHEWSRWRGLALLMETLLNLNQIGAATQYARLILTREGVPDNIRDKAEALAGGSL